MVDDVGLTRDGVVAGTPPYMAPEQARGEGVDHRADLFSLGSVLYALCTGVPPFRGSSALAVLREVSEQEPTPIRSLNPEVPAWLEALIARLMAKKPADRFQSGFVSRLCLAMVVVVALGLGGVQWWAGAGAKTETQTEYKEQRVHAPDGKGWMVPTGIIGGLLLLTLGVSLAVRHLSSRKTTMVAVTAISLRCTGCEKKLKARAELAGKKVKCPHCSKVVLVPSFQADGPGNESGQRRRLSRVLVALPAPLRVLFMLVVLGLGLTLIVLSLAVGGQEPAPEPASARNQLRYDFRTRLEELPDLSLFGPEAESVVKTDEHGLRFTMPANRTDCNNLGVERPLPIRGDFSIDLGYEILSIGAPIPVPGAGVQLRLLYANPSPMWALTRLRSPFGPQRAPLFGVVGHDGEIFGAFRIITLPNFKEDGFSGGTRLRAEAPRGRLRMTRTGPQLNYLVSDDGSPYHLLRSEEIGTEDVELVRFFAFSGWGPVAVDVRFTDLVIEADRIADVNTVRVNWSKARLAGGLILGLVLTLSIVVSGWFFLRPGRRASA
jgi:hypothetical protein